MPASSEPNHILGIDIGGTKCAVSLADRSGALLDRTVIATQASGRTWEAVLSELAGAAAGLLSRHDAPLLIGCGISCGGPTDITAGEILAPPALPGWDRVPVRAYFEQRLDVQVRIENDANATAVAEWKLGAGRGANNLAFLTIGTGIGAGLILDGRVFRGATGLAGEVGHQTVVPDGPLCSCGKYGCLEALASGPAIASLARETAAYGRNRRLVELAGGHASKITAEHIVASALAGDAFSRDILTMAGTYLGMGIANLLQILNLELVILGTVAIHAGDLLLEPTRAAVRKYAWPSIADACAIKAAALGDRAQDMAAISLWL